MGMEESATAQPYLRQQDINSNPSPYFTTREYIVSPANELFGIHNHYAPKSPKTMGSTNLTLHCALFVSCS